MIAVSRLAVGLVLISALLPARASAETGVLLAGPSADSKLISTTLAIARGKRALGQVRKLYSASEFDACAKAAAAAELELAAVWRPTSTVFRRQQRHVLDYLKQLAGWLGACQAVLGQHAQAKSAFARANAIEGRGVDLSLFPPRVAALNSEARDASLTCKARWPAQRRLWINGQRKREHAIRVGSHYACWRDESANHSVSGWLNVDEKCQLTFVALTAPTRLSADELSDNRLIKQLIELAGVSRLALIGTGTGLGFDAIDAQGHSALAAALTKASKRDELGNEQQATAWYRRWWVWAAGAAVVATAIIVPVALSNRDTTYQIGF
ncbi:MAG: hypothetical protein H6707_01605 [Deltaproteobacteria bacterium]|nr:hypothetical protein [Deltaproteobacteria bacterium]